GLERVETLRGQTRHSVLLGVAVGYVGPSSLVLVVGPKQILRLIADRVEVLFDVAVEFQRVGGEGFLDLGLSVKGLGAVARHVQRLARELWRLAGAVDREQPLNE